VVIPEDIRNRLKLKTGSRFVVVGKNDVIILKTIASPTMADFDDLVTEARKQAQKAGLRPGDISDAIKRVRRRK
jgi:bifunctional DNA-binding transcriptional regulator/antitoxin component of YhaV-PrlF toxin-antitoxin module